MNIPKIYTPDEFVSYLGALFMAIGLIALVMGSIQGGGIITLMGLCIMLVGLVYWEKRTDYSRARKKKP